MNICEHPSDREKTAIIHAKIHSKTKRYVQMYDEK